jgi:hypothetical protein
MGQSINVAQNSAATNTVWRIEKAALSKAKCRTTIERMGRTLMGMVGGERMLLNSILSERATKKSDVWLQNNQTPLSHSFFKSI